MRGKKSFTMVELLIIIAIITILGSFLLPAFSSGVNQARLAACRGNQHQIGTALQMYTAENSGIIPNNISGMEKASIPLLRMPDNNIIALGRLLNGYIKCAHIFGCPDSPGFREHDVDTAWQNTPMVWSAYLYRAQDNNFDPLLSAPENQDKAILADFACIKPSGNITPHDLLMCNLLYSDGHVESRRNTPEPFEIYTLQARMHGEMIPDCSTVWLNADKSDW